MKAGTIRGIYCRRKQFGKNCSTEITYILEMELVKYEKS